MVKIKNELTVAQQEESFMSDEDFYTKHKDDLGGYVSFTEAKSIILDNAGN